MKFILLLVMLFTSSSFISTKNSKPKAAAAKWIVTQNSSLSVNGTTNIGKFSCTIVKYSNTDTLVIDNDKASNFTLTGAINIEVANFGCSNFMMTRELRKTLKASKYPQLHVKFLSLKEIANVNKKTSTVCGNVEITIAGVSKRFEISYQLHSEKNKMTLVGAQPINFSDFNLIPPKKVGHLVRAYDKLVVIFDLNLIPI